MVEVKVVADFREKPSGIPSLLSDLGVKVTFQNLSVGDYILPNGYAVERKEVGDFLSSMLSGRLFDQAYRLTEAYRFPVFVVEGNFHAVLEDFSNPRSVWGALASLSLRYGVHAFYTGDKEQTGNLIYVLARQTAHVRHPEPVVRERRKIQTLSEAQLHVVSSLPWVGPKMADRMLRRFGSARRVFNASTLELASVKGLGRVRASKICELLDAAYKPLPQKSYQRMLEEEA